MRLRAIGLKDIRRFTDPVRIEGIADGVNVLCAPNEYGKSTVFDALRALFFIPHGSRGKEIGQLRPHAGGAPEVSVEIETPEGSFTVAKRWFTRPEARVTRGGTLIAQADEAEAWISRLLGGGDGGPSGLLWVRQGITGLGDGSNKEQQAALDARRDLLSSVTGEVEAMTGGRRMDAALARCQDELAAYATRTGRPRTGGPWADAAQDVETLTQEAERLSQSLTRLQSALDERGHARRELAELEAPDAMAERKSRLDAAKAAHAAAEAHAARIAAAEQSLENARIAAQRAKADLAALRTATTDAAAAGERNNEAMANVKAAEEALAAAEKTHFEAIAAHDGAEAARQQADALVRQVQARAASLASGERRAELEDRLARARSARQEVEAATAEAGSGPDDAAMEALRTFWASLTTARALRDSTATRVTMRYAPGRAGSVRHGETPVDDDTILSIHADAILQIEGIGALTIHPGESPEGLADVATAERKLADALAALGVGTLDEAGRAHRSRKEAADRLTGLRAELAALAPKGIDDLQKQLAALPDPISGENPDLPCADKAEADLLRARNAAVELAARREAARERRDAARMARAEAAVRQDAAAERLEAARAAVERLANRDEAELAAMAEASEAARANAEAALEQARTAAPDIAAAAATLARAQSVEDAARRRIDELRPALAALNERIAGNSGEAVEERLQETTERLEAAGERLARFEREVKVLQRLQAALDTARAEARDRYFEPVAAELRPLLQLLWPDAELNWADDTLLPRSLIRNGAEERVDILSGGTQEQIALLVRLAFARLMAKDGRHAPVILDDALVFTDDDRIERMFDALHRQAGDLQIIVLSCRQRAFRDLGGHTLRISETDTAAAG